MSDNAAVRGLDVVLRNLRAIGGGAKEYMMSVLEEVMEQDVKPLYLKHIGLTDHSLEELRKLGHPYSRRFGADSFVHPDDYVHKQSGRLVSMTYSETADDSVRLISEAPEYLYLRFGTSKMRMRDPGGDVLQEALPAIKSRVSARMKDAFVEYLQRG
jgi:hypothetical protein